MPDEPITGLHPTDLEHPLGLLLDRLVESEKSVILIEHHQAVMAHSHWLIDLGPLMKGTKLGSRRVAFSSC